MDTLTPQLKKELARKYPDISLQLKPGEHLGASSEGKLAVWARDEWGVYCTEFDAYLEANPMPPKNEENQLVTPVSAPVEARRGVLRSRLPLVKRGSRSVRRGYRGKSPLKSGTYANG